jgi:hypothetical protein
MRGGGEPPDAGDPDAAASLEHLVHDQRNYDADPASEPRSQQGKDQQQY